jgi:hypothetical protein
MILENDALLTPAGNSRFITPKVTLTPITNTVNTTTHTHSQIIPPQHQQQLPPHTPQVTPQATPPAIPPATPHATPNATPNATSQATTQAPTPATPSTTPSATPSMPPPPKKMRSYEESQYNLRYSEFVNKEDRANQIIKMEGELIQHKIRIETEIGEKKKAVEDEKLLNEKKKEERLKELHFIKLRIIKKLEGVFCVFFNHFFFFQILTAL